MNKIDYHEYISSDAWAEKREKFIAKNGKVCRACGYTIGTFHVHHLTYERLGNERMTDLMLLCWPCHKELHMEYKAQQQLVIECFRPDLKIDLRKFSHKFAKQKMKVTKKEATATETIRKALSAISYHGKNAFDEDFVKTAKSKLPYYEARSRDFQQFHVFD